MCPIHPAAALLPTSGSHGPATTATSAEVTLAYDKTHYGIPLVEAGETNLDPRRNVFTLPRRTPQSEWLHQFNKRDIRLRRYRHDELDGEVVATSFKNDSDEFNLLLGHRPAGKLKGSIGLFCSDGARPKARNRCRRWSTSNAHLLRPYEEARDQPARDISSSAAGSSTPVNAGRRPRRDSRRSPIGRTARSSDRSDHAGVQPGTGGAQPRAGGAVFPRTARRQFRVRERQPRIWMPRPAQALDVSLPLARIAQLATTYFNNISNFIQGAPASARRRSAGDEFRGGRCAAQASSFMPTSTSPAWWRSKALDYVHGRFAIGRPADAEDSRCARRLGVRVQKNALQIGADAVFTAEQDRIFVTETPEGAVGETPTADQTS